MLKVLLVKLDITALANQILQMPYSVNYYNYERHTLGINVCRIIFLEIKLFFSSCRAYANQSLPLPALQPLESCFFTVFKSCFKLGAPVPSLPRTGQKERKGKGKT